MNKFLRSGFSLLETLIAMAILITVVLASIALSNSLIRGTVANADEAIVNRWAAEGLERTTKIRDDRILSGVTGANGLPVWFDLAFADNGGSYGWYKLNAVTVGGVTHWELSPLGTSGARVIGFPDFRDGGERLTSGEVVGYRLICVEAVGAVSSSATTSYQCNTSSSGQAAADGSRTVFDPRVCQTGDAFCELTRNSLRSNRLASDVQTIQPGNAIKLRSVVVWEAKDEIRVADIATMMTNWRNYGS